MKNIALIITFLTILISTINAQNIKFHVQNLEATPATGPWMFDADSTNPYANDGEGNYAYRNFNWQPAGDGVLTFTTTSSCIDNNTGLIFNLGNVTLKVYNFTLAGFEHINTVDIDENWNNLITRDAGDRRIYVNGIGEIYENGDLVLEITNCKLETTIPYPDEEDMRLITGNALWPGDVGTGEVISATGWGSITEYNDGTHNPRYENWYDKFKNAQINDQLQFSFDAFKPVIQGDTGYYNFNITIQKAPHLRIIRMRDLDFAKSRSTELDFNTGGDDCDVMFNFTDADYGGLDNTEKEVVVTKIETSPGGTLPTGINSLAPQYWQIGTTLESFTTDITFDLEGISNIGSITSLRVLKRKDASDEWDVIIPIVVGDDLKVTEVSTFSEWAIGSQESGTLPVEMSDFSAIHDGENVEVIWTTQSEVNTLGFDILRSNINDLSSAQKINNEIILATNTTIAHNYSFIDTEHSNQGELYYWIKSIDFDGYTEFFGPAIINFEQQILELESYETEQFNSNGIYLSWNVSNMISEIQFFDIYRSTNENFIDAKIINSDKIFIENNLNGRYSYVDKSIQLGESYYYWITAKDWDNILYAFPVKFIKFAHYKFDEVSERFIDTQLQISWKSMFESDIKDFKLMKSVDNNIQEAEIIAVITPNSEQEYSSAINVINGEKFYYWISAETNSAELYKSNIKSIEVPALNKLLGNYPNPFTVSSSRNKGTEIHYIIEDSKNSELSIYNVLGQKVYTTNNLQKGKNSFLWTGIDNSNNEVSSGVYFYRLSINGRDVSSKKMLLLK